MSDYEKMWNKLKHYLKDETLIMDEFALDAMKHIEKDEELEI